MGRRKIEMKRIEDKSSRQVTFSKRRSGVMKKAAELSVLCDLDVALIVFSSRGRLYQSFSGSSSLSEVLERYQDCTASDGKASTKATYTEELQEFRSRIPELQTCSELVGTVARHLESPDLEHRSVDDFMILEEQLTAALVETRARKTQLMLETIVALQEQVRKVKSNHNGNLIDVNQMAKNESDNGNEMGNADNHNNGNRLRLESSHDGGKNMVRNNDHDKNQIGLEYVSLVSNHTSCSVPQRTLPLLQ